MARQDDAKIIQRVLGGETNAYAELLERYGAKVYGLVVRLVGIEAEAEELTQDAFVQAYTHLSVEGETQNRIYMLQYTGDRAMTAHDGKVTIVIKIKPDK